MKRVKYSIYILAAIVLAGTACKKSFLEIDPQQNTDVAQTVTDVPSTRAAVNGIYALLQSANSYGRTASLIPDLMSDNLQISVINANRYQPQDQYAMAANDGMATNLWNNLYQVVANANLVIEKGEPLEVPVADTAEKRKLVGQAYALRAFGYFSLVRFFAQPYNFSAGATHLGVPITLKTATDKSGVVALGRNSVKENYDQIIKDLDSAVSKLNTDTAATSTSSKTRFNYFGGLALLSRVYLYKEDYAKAIDAANKVIDRKKYTLLPGATLVADFRKQSNAETIFEVAFTATDNNSTDALGYFYAQGGYGDAIATDTMYKIYTAADARRGFITRSRRTGTGGENPANIVNKYNNITTYEENLKVLRLAEVYLNRAEAYAYSNQDNLARADLNVITTRGDAAATVPGTLAGDDLKAAILVERRKEFAFEGHRLFDLTRRKQTFTKTRRGTITFIVNAPENKTILPIPQREMDANPAIKGQQNPGYGN
ncbi:RagB/SusD family nutrient uptake outer membrane protein [Paraflavitalea pollutisoli]|uniref:RagB/SusD family nutrient uptake outer membrane protein n=1 Tax=Paraflavitalea pollutisoli TaxID=3034143 RepID=UPI0023ED1866|nr:RagB/SusD family nutrient uptake outer membrane protein [Paraflavitalea sp. H1-2-19X]